MLYPYHSVTMAERPEEVLAGRLDLVAHVQIADVPGRHEPGSGTIDWPAVIGWLSASGYAGRIGLEFIPSADTCNRWPISADLCPDGCLPASLPKRLPYQTITVVIRHRRPGRARTSIPDEVPILIVQWPTDRWAVVEKPPGLVPQPR
jgi:hypothetical protein